LVKNNKDNQRIENFNNGPSARNKLKENGRSGKKDEKNPIKIN